MEECLWGAPFHAREPWTGTGPAGPVSVLDQEVRARLQVRNRARCSFSAATTGRLVQELAPARPGAPRPTYAAVGRPEGDLGVDAATGPGRTSGHLGRGVLGAVRIQGALRRLLQDELGLPLRVGAAHGQLLGQQVGASVDAVLIGCGGIGRRRALGHGATVRGPVDAARQQPQDHAYQAPPSGEN